MANLNKEDNNIELSVQGTELVIRVDLERTLRGTGRDNLLIASTGSWTEILGDKTLSLNMALVRRTRVR